MPFIEIQVLEGFLTEEQKLEMIRRVSEVAAEIEAHPHPKDKLLAVTSCRIKEVPEGNWGVGGQPLTADLLKQIIEG